MLLHLGGRGHIGDTSETGRPTAHLAMKILLGERWMTRLSGSGGIGGFVVGTSAVVDAPSDAIGQRPTPRMATTTDAGVVAAATAASAG